MSEPKNSFMSPFVFTLICMAMMGGLIGLVAGVANGSGPLGLISGALFMFLISFLAIFLRQKESIVRYSICFFLIIFGFLFIGIIGVFLGLILGWFSGWFLYWLHLGRYRAKLQPYLSAGQVLWHYTFRVICGVIFVFLITPILVVMPLSFNAQDFFTFTPEMLRFDPDGYSLKHLKIFLRIMSGSGRLKIHY